MSDELRGFGDRHTVSGQLSDRTGGRYLAVLGVRAFWLCGNAAILENLGTGTQFQDMGTGT